MCLRDAKKIWIISVTVCRYEGEVSQKKIASLFRTTVLCFPVSYMDILRNALEVQFFASHAHSYHASNTENPIFYAATILTKILRQFTSLIKILLHSAYFYT